MMLLVIDSGAFKSCTCNVLEFSHGLLAISYVMLKSELSRLRDLIVERCTVGIEPSRDIKILPRSMFSASLFLASSSLSLDVKVSGSLRRLTLRYFMLI